MPSDKLFYQLSYMVEKDVFSTLFLVFSWPPKFSLSVFSSNPNSLVVTVCISFRWRLLYLYQTRTHWSVWTDHPGE